MRHEHNSIRRLVRVTTFKSQRMVIERWEQSATIDPNRPYRSRPAAIALGPITSTVEVAS